MSEEKIRAIVRRYKIISTLWLLAFSLFAVFSNWYFVKSSIDRHYELGFDYVSGKQGYILLTIILGLYFVLYLAFYSLERVLLFTHQENHSSS
jgi:hypothetical protein